MLAVTTTPYTVMPIPLTAPRGSGSSHIQAQQQQPHTLARSSHVSFFSRRPELTRQPSWHLIYGEINITHNWVQFGSVRLSSTRLTFSLALSSIITVIMYTQVSTWMQISKWISNFVPISLWIVTLRFHCAHCKWNVCRSF